LDRAKSDVVPAGNAKLGEKSVWKNGWKGMARLAGIEPTTLGFGGLSSVLFSTLSIIP
jgi:hypothetical protein